MGTNFYWIDRGHEEGEEHPLIHIGKRSAAGGYCWDCGITLCSEGSGAVHHDGEPWYTSCQNCEKETQVHGPSQSTGAVELGMAKSKEILKEGVTSACSFLWTMMKHKWDLLALQSSKTKVVRDEYGREYTAKEFLEEELATVAFEAQHYGHFC